ncbi:DUF2779 domain-containing protein [Haloferula sp. A504]|uniref:DUF2779 domain-containing protein n=1 Tax=Haloferula sp. A504 TaxID=3373601 RepID=UPI0031C4ED50|nr:DUF2779 domain-containing protein [Verrucomicrobiaceae bacterium E54]
MRQLSKSKIIAFRQCPKRLWLELHRPELRDDSGSEMVFAIGNQVGDVARQIYDTADDGRLIDVAEIGWDAAFSETAAWLSGTPAPLFEAAIRIEGALALADVMLPEAGDGGLRWHMLEVKSSTGVKDYHREDLAVQTYIATAAGIDLASASLAHVDNSFVYPGGGDYQGLLTAVDLTEEARSMAGDVANWISEAQEVAALTVEPEIETGPHCSAPFDCPFRHHCDQNMPSIEFPLGSLHRVGPKKRDELEALGYDDLREVPDEMLSPVNRMIKKQSVAGEAWFDAEGAATDLAPHTGTSYFLDCETIGFGVPIWKGTRPYQQLPFQFSLHIVSHDGEVEHREFLDLSGEDPGEAFAQALIDHCGTTGPVFVYNAGFENGVMRGLADRFPHLATGLLSIVDRVVDLLPIARNRYYHPSQHGSWSIKAVLPALCPELSYDVLDGVKDGHAAQRAFLEAMAPETAPKRKQKIERELLEYCKLDTLAMVRIWEVFSGQRDLV